MNRTSSRTCTSCHREEPRGRAFVNRPFCMQEIAHQPAGEVSDAASCTPNTKPVTAQTTTIDAVAVVAIIVGVLPVAALQTGSSIRCAGVAAAAAAATADVVARGKACRPPPPPAPPPSSPSSSSGSRRLSRRRSSNSSNSCNSSRRSRSRSRSGSGVGSRQ